MWTINASIQQPVCDAVALEACPDQMLWARSQLCCLCLELHLRERGTKDTYNPVICLACPQDMGTVPGAVQRVAPEAQTCCDLLL